MNTISNNKIDQCQQPLAETDTDTSTVTQTPPEGKATPTVVIVPPSEENPDAAEDYSPSQETSPWTNLSMRTVMELAGDTMSTALVPYTAPLAKEIPLEAVRAHLLETLPENGWEEYALNFIKDSGDQLMLYIELCARAKRELSTFTSAQWESLILAIARMLADKKCCGIVEHIKTAQSHWVSKKDQRRVRFALMGAACALSDMIHEDSQFNAWVDEFGAQPAKERKILRGLFHDKREKREFKNLPDELQVWVGDIMPTIMLTTSYWLKIYEAHGDACGVEDEVNPEGEFPFHTCINTGKVEKKLIVGIKRTYNGLSEMTIKVVAKKGLACETVDEEELEYLL